MMMMIMLMMKHYKSISFFNLQNNMLPSKIIFTARRDLQINIKLMMMLMTTLTVMMMMMMVID